MWHQKWTKRVASTRYAPMVVSSQQVKALLLKTGFNIDVPLK